MYRYLFDLPDVVSANLALGRAVHTALGENFAQKIETKLDLAPIGVEALFLDALARELVKRCSLQTITWQTCVIPAARAHHHLHGPGSLHHRSRVCGTSRLGPHRRRTGAWYFDLLDTQGRIIDFKTAKKKPAGSGRVSGSLRTERGVGQTTSCVFAAAGRARLERAGV